MSRAAARPWLLRVLPLRLGMSVYARRYRTQASRWPQLYHAAPLRFAPQIRMHGLQPGDVISDYLAFTGVYEYEASLRMLELGRRGGTLIDVGANMGYFSLLFAQAHPDNQVHAFEAAPRIAALLRANVLAAGLQDRIHIHECAVAEQAGTLRFDPGPATQSGWGGLTPAGSIEVQARRLDECIPAHTPITLLKIDIEGADTWALRSAAALFAKGQIAEVWFEQHLPRMRMLGIGVDEARDWLEARGFALRARGTPEADLVEWVALPRTASPRP